MNFLKGIFGCYCTNNLHRVAYNASLSLCRKANNHNLGLLQIHRTMDACMCC